MDIIFTDYHTFQTGGVQFDCVPGHYLTFGLNVQGTGAHKCQFFFLGVNRLIYMETVKQQYKILL
jgi:hypothetical protein